MTIRTDIAYIVGVASLAVLLAALAGGDLAWSDDWYAEDPVVDEDTGDEEILLIVAHSSAPSRGFPPHPSSRPTYTPESRGHSRLFLLQSSFRC